MTPTLPAHAQAWTFARRLTDRLPRILPGRHHPVWGRS